MYVTNPRKTISKPFMDCGDRAEVTIAFDAAAGLSAEPFDLVLLMDRSGSMTQERLNYAKAAADQLITTVQAASGGTDAIANGSRLGIVSFADEATEDAPLTVDTAQLRAAIAGLNRGGLTNHQAAFALAETMLADKAAARQVVVMFTDGKTTVGGSAAETVQRMKDAGIEIFCIGLVTDPAPLLAWATDPDNTHVAYTDDPAQLDRVFREITAEVVLAGALDVRIQETLTPEFKIVRITPPDLGTVTVIDPQTLEWNIGAAGLTSQPEPVSLTFEIMHIGTEGGARTVNQALTYQDRAGNELIFPGLTTDVDCSGVIVYPEACPDPTAFRAAACQDAVQVKLPWIRMQSLGRIIQVDATVRHVCPGKRVAAAIVLTEVGPNGEEYARGTKTVLLPVLTGEQCRDVTMRCIPFVVPEQLDAAGDPLSICNARNFHARVLANYVDTDFVCCDAEAVML